MLQKLIQATHTKTLHWALGLFCLALSAVLSMAPYYFSWRILVKIIDTWPNMVSWSLVYVDAYLAVGCSILGVLTRSIGGIGTHLAAFQAEYNLRERAYKALQKVPLGYFVDKSSGEIRKDMDANIDLTHNLIAHQSGDFVGALTILCIALPCLFVINWVLACAVLFSILLAAVPMMFLMGISVREGMQKYMQALSTMSGATTEYVRGMSVVKLFGQTAESFRSFKETVVAYKAFVYAYCLRCRMPMVLFTFLLTLPVMWIAVAVQLFLSSMGEHWLADALLFVFLLPFFMGTLMRLMLLGESMSMGAYGIQSVEEIERAIEKEEGVLETFSDFGDIRMENLHFTYKDSNEETLKGINLHAKNGMKMAIIGPSGSGKSTLAYLIPKFYQVEDGMLYLNDKDSNTYREEACMQGVSFFFQHAKLFNKSLRENLCPKETTTDKELYHALEKAQAMDIVAKLPNGLDSLIGVGGSYLSGGEVARVLLARAFLKDAPILVLDEATAFADAENEYYIQEGISNIAKEKTVVMIAHRLSSVQNVDAICVLQKGKIIEQGSAEELLDQKGIYARLWKAWQENLDWHIGGAL